MTTPSTAPTTDHPSRVDLTRRGSAGRMLEALGQVGPAASKRPPLEQAPAEAWPDPDELTPRSVEPAELAAMLAELEAMDGDPDAAAALRAIRGVIAGSLRRLAAAKEAEAHIAALPSAQAAHLLDLIDRSLTLCRQVEWIAAEVIVALRDVDPVIDDGDEHPDAYFEAAYAAAGCNVLSLIWASIEYAGRQATNGPCSGGMPVDDAVSDGVAAFTASGPLVDAARGGAS